MKKFIALVTLTFFLVFNPGQSHALVPLALINPTTVGAVVAGVGVLAAGTAYYAPSVYQAGASAVDSAKSVASTSLIATKAIAVGASQYLYGKAVQAEIGLDALAAWAQQNVGQAPLTAAVANAGSNNSYRNPVHPGDILDPGDGYALRQATTQTTTYGGCTTSANCDMVLALWNGWNATRTTYSTAAIISTTIYPDGSQSSRVERITTSTVAAPAGSTPTNPRVLDIGKFGDGVRAAIQAGGEAVTNELQRAIAANPAAVSVPGISPAEGQQAYDQAAAQTMQDAAGELQAGADAHPELTPAQIAAMEAQTAADLKALENAKELDKPEEVPEVLPPAVAPALHEIDLSPLNDLQGILIGKFPFSIAPAAAGFFNQLLVPAVAPSMTFSTFFGNFNITFEKWNDHMEFLRGLTAFFFHISVLYVIVRTWSN